MNGGFDRKPGGSSRGQQEFERGPVSPGKRTLTEHLAGAEALQMRQATGSEARPAEGEELTELHAAAAAGVSGPGGALPHAEKIQAAFGPAHDVLSINAHVGGAAVKATENIGAEAYATRNQVAFSKPPDLHTRGLR